MAEEALTTVFARPDVRRELSLIHTVLQFGAAQHPDGELARLWLNALVEGERLFFPARGPAPIVEAISPFAANPDSSRVAKLLAEQGAESGFPATDYDRVLTARLWRLAGETELATRSLEAVPAESDAVGLAIYETARALLEAGRGAPGARVYWSACARADERVRAEIAWDLLPVTTPDEREAWLDVPAGVATCEWLRDFWDERALRAAVGRDERLALHFRRMAEARERYRLKRPRVLEGMADFYGRPPRLAVDDRGLLWIRLGPPDEDVSCPEHVLPERARNDIAPNLLGRCWVYSRPAGYKIYYLSTRDRFEDELPYGDYRIQENLGQ